VAGGSQVEAGDGQWLDARGIGSRTGQDGRHCRRGMSGSRKGTSYSAGARRRTGGTARGLGARGPLSKFRCIIASVAAGSWRGHEQGLVCYGQAQGSRVTYTLLEEPAEAEGLEEGPAALAWAARRYLWAYGPATHQDFGAWFSIKTVAARRVFESLGSEIEPVSVEGWKAWQLVGRQESLPLAESVHLLPHFDCYVVACRPRELLAPFDLAERLSGRVPRLFERSLRHHDVKTMNTVFVNGRLAGFWERKQTGRRLAITVELLRRLSGNQTDLVELAARRTGEIFEAEASLVIGRANIRPHL
jgi:Winged helix DNA-binding domain